MSFNKSDYSEILTQITARIVAQVSELTADSCFISLHRDEMPPESATPSANGLVCGVAPGAGTFDQAFLDGGGIEQCKFDTVVVCTLWTMAAYEGAQGHADNALSNSTKGVYTVAKQILKALTAYVLQDSGGNDITVDTVLPSSMGEPISRDGGPLSLSVEFNVSWFWDLS